MKRPIFLPQAFQICLFHVLFAFLVSQPAGWPTSVSTMPNPTLRSTDQKWATSSIASEFVVARDNHNANTGTNSLNERSDREEPSPKPSSKPSNSEEPSTDPSRKPSPKPSSKPSNSEEPSTDSDNSGSTSGADSTGSMDEEDSNVGALAGGVAGGVAGFLVIAVAVRFAVRRPIVEDVPEIDIQDNWNGAPSYVDAAVARRRSRERRSLGR